MRKTTDAIHAPSAPDSSWEVPVNPASPRRRNIPPDRINVTVWLSVKEAAKKLSVSTDTIERRAIEWQESPERYKVRYKYLVLDGGAEPVRRYYEPDVEAMLCQPKLLPAASQARLVPKRLQSSSGIYSRKSGCSCNAKLP